MSRRVVLLQLPALARGIIRSLIERQPGLTLARDFGGRVSLAQAVAATGADVAVLAAGDHWEQEVLEALDARPRLRVVVIADDGRRGVSCALRPEVTRIEDLSPERLLHELTRPPERSL